MMTTFVGATGRPSGAAHRFARKSGKRNRITRPSSQTAPPEQGVLPRTDTDKVKSLLPHKQNHGSAVICGWSCMG